ncbi:MAG: 3-isopropylmalate dehydratase small subunit [Nanoarchaeota archaeon]|nr:3-isopropylmalate dehydratase small subunit [Nanoarchaeota archaeon]
MTDRLLVPSQKIVLVNGSGIPKPADNQNTDDILPARFMKETTFKRMGEYVYFDERFKDGQKVVEHPFNNPKYSRGSILIAGANYGTGSSREHAPQGLYRFGIRGIIAESYADIFDGNCATIGIAAVRISREDISLLVKRVEKDPETNVAVNLLAKTVSYIDKIVGCEIPEGTRQALINGSWDAFSVLQRNEDKAREVATRLPYLSFQCFKPQFS